MSAHYVVKIWNIYLTASSILPDSFIHSFIYVTLQQLPTRSPSKWGTFLWCKADRWINDCRYLQEQKLLQSGENNAEDWIVSGFTGEVVAASSFEDEQEDTRLKGRKREFWLDRTVSSKAQSKKDLSLDECLLTHLPCPRHNDDTSRMLR